MTLYTDTPMGKAVLELVENLSYLLAEKGNPPGTCRAYIFGGCALHLHTKARGSSDLDVELEAAKKVSIGELVLELDDIFYDDPDTGPSSIVLDETFNPTLAPLHELYQEEAIRLNPNEDSSTLEVYVVQKVDLAISKLGRYGDQDIDDIHTLFSHGLDIEEFRKRALEASKYYVGNVSTLTSHIEHVINTFKP